MDKRTANDIELNLLLDEIKKYALSPEGRDNITYSLFTSDKAELDKRYHEIDSLINLLEGAEPLDTFPSLAGLFEYSERTHLDIPGEYIYLTGEFLHAYITLEHFLSEETYSFDEELSKEILSSLNSDGEVRDDHPRILPLIKERDSIKRDRVNFSQEYILKNKEIVQNENPLYRNERVVIPIISKEKRNGEYYVVGSSQTGLTTLIEPFELVSLNNRVVLQEEKIRQTKRLILSELSNRVRTIIPQLKKMRDRVILFDFYYVFALWARRVKAEHPREGNKLIIKSFKHPLLKDKAVPITLELEHGERIVVLSGANAGGKTVTMKSVALSVALNQICTFIPAEESSTLPIFDAIYSDIGDNQSLLETQSTFSSHMTNIASIMKKCTPKSLVILDELGSGTDPEEGSVLSVSILDYLREKAGLTLITSHYSMVKNYAYTENGMINCSMEFSLKSNKPTFRVISGVPGDSHALSLASRSGMPKSVIEEAKAKLSSDSATSASIITSLLSKSKTLDRKMTELETEKRGLLNKINENEKLNERLKEEENILKKEGVREINIFLRETRSELENLVKDLKTGVITKDKTKRVKEFIKKIEDKEEELSAEIIEDEEDYSNHEEFKIGDEVLCGKAKIRGKITRINNNLYSLTLENGLRMEMKVKDIVHAKKESIKPQISTFTSKETKAQYVLDVRGKTLNETIEILDKQLEAALLSNMSSFSIIHGYGDGILQRGVQDYLKRNKYVSDYHFALPEDGGMGKTYVELNEETKPK